MTDSGRDLGALPDGEEWRAPLGYRGWYKVSNLGRIRRGDRILRPIFDRYGYATVNLSVNGVRSREKIHRLVCYVFNGPPPTRGHEVGHLDGNPRNNAAANLAWVTRSENVRHAITHGTFVGDTSAATAASASKDRRGTKNPNAKLTDEQVQQMRLMGAEGYSERVIARTFGCSPTTAHRIIAGVSYVEG